MSIKTRCPSCSKVFRAQDSYLHRNMKCPSCKTKFMVKTLEEYEEEATKKAEDQKQKAGKPCIIRKKRKYLMTPAVQSDRPDLKKLKDHIPKHKKHADRGKHVKYGIETLAIGDSTFEGLTLIQTRKYIYEFFHAAGYKFKWKSMKEATAKKGFLGHKYVIYLRPAGETSIWVSINDDFLLLAGKDRYKMHDRDSGSGKLYSNAWKEFHKLLFLFRDKCLEDGFLKPK